MVVLSPLPYVGLFIELVRLLAPLYFRNGKPALEAACQNVASWPSPVEGLVCEVPFLGEVFALEIPNSASRIPARCRWKQTPLHVVATVRPKALFSCFKASLPDLWLCWELTLLGEPVIVLAASPSVCSEAVFALLSLIAPLSYTGDFRPYFTVHDADFPDLAPGPTTTPRLPPRSLLLGVTNPLFAGQFDAWPHRMCLGELVVRGAASQRSASPFLGNSSSESRLWPPQGVWSKRKRFVARDTALLQFLLEPDQGLCVPSRRIRS